jgi:PilZ domain-containing protein
LRLRRTAFVVATIHQPYSKQWRVPFVRRCHVEWGSSKQDAVCCNISADGVYIVIHPIPPVGEMVQLRFELPGNEIPVVVEAEVCWENSGQRHKVHSLPPGCGLRFVDLLASDRARIADLVKEYREPGPRRLRRI